MLGAALAALAASASAVTITGTVSRVLDGDTIEISTVCNTVSRIRMIGIDAPEIKQTYGIESRDALAALIMGKVVRVETAVNDLYGRSLGLVYIDDADVNLYQLMSGNAWYYVQGKRYLTHPARNAYEDAVKQAKAAKNGLWADPFPVAPWVIRKSLSEQGK